MDSELEVLTVASRVTLRPAVSQAGEGQLFACYLNQAAEGFFRFLLGGSYTTIIASAYEKTNHDLSHENVTFAELEGKVVGMYSGFTAEEHRRASPSVLVQAAGGWNFRFWIISTLFSPILRVIDRVNAGDYYLQAIAVESGVRGFGIGSMLLDSAEKKAREKGALRIVLDVSENNIAALQMYRRHGFTVENSWPKRLRIPAITLFRMAKELGN